MASSPQLPTLVATPSAFTSREAAPCRGTLELSCSVDKDEYCSKSEDAEGHVTPATVDAQTTPRAASKVPRVAAAYVAAVTTPPSTPLAKPLQQRKRQFPIGAHATPISKPRATTIAGVTGELLDKSEKPPRTPTGTKSKQVQFALAADGAGPLVAKAYLEAVTPTTDKSSANTEELIAKVATPLSVSAHRRNTIPVQKVSAQAQAYLAAISSAPQTQLAICPATSSPGCVNGAPIQVGPLVEVEFVNVEESDACSHGLLVNIISYLSHLLRQRNLWTTSEEAGYKGRVRQGQLTDDDSSKSGCPAGESCTTATPAMRVAQACGRTAVLVGAHSIALAETVHSLLTQVCIRQSLTSKSMRVFSFASFGGSHLQDPRCNGPKVVDAKDGAAIVRSGLGAALQTRTMVVAASATAGGAALGSGAFAAGCLCGGAVGTVLGAVPAVFTLGLSIPIGAVVGSGIGGGLSAIGGMTVGAVCGGAAGSQVYDKLRSSGLKDA